MNTSPEEVAHEARRKTYELEFAAAQLGTQNQRERFLEDLLPEDELLALARAELFKPFEGFKRWARDTRLYARDVRHVLSCEEHGSDTDTAQAIVFETTTAGELTHDEWVVYRQLGEARTQAALHPWLDGMGAVMIEPLSHFATCSVCQGEACRTSAKLTIAWAGRKLVREYVLQ